MNLCELKLQLATAQRCLLLPLKITAALEFISYPPEVGKKKKKSIAKDPKRDAHRPVGTEK